MRKFDVRLFRTIERLLRVLVVSCDVIMTAHCGICLCGRGSWVGEWIGGYSLCGFILLLLASYLFRFCWRYRACLAHNFIVYCAIIFEREYGLFGMDPSFAWAFLFISGLIVICSILPAPRLFR